MWKGRERIINSKSVKERKKKESNGEIKIEGK
jgi:hypothetical protein